MTAYGKQGNRHLPMFIVAWIAGTRFPANSRYQSYVAIFALQTRSG
jgi:hypothetical protein